MTEEEIQLLRDIEEVLVEFLPKWGWQMSVYRHTRLLEVLDRVRKAIR